MGNHDSYSDTFNDHTPVRQFQVFGNSLRYEERGNRQKLIVPVVPDFPHHVVQRGVGRMVRVYGARRAAGRSIRKGNESILSPGNPVDSFCTPLYTSLHEIVDQ